MRVTGHAGYAEEGSDIVCSAVTILVINTVNCIERFCKEPFHCQTDEVKGGFLVCDFPELRRGKENHDVDLLLETMVHGLNDIKHEYCNYITITDREVQ